ncbi:hypothetical protein L6452_43552 [Arctium lappa]|uniref:Uncharacterized protein n=1 Tax=Arctium lappa TaxID=4217 RepID=A0ACB8XDK2_ARCLA|nr:hypothetical protein L6452_43552 [Arctium lappa]
MVLASKFNIDDFISTLDWLDLQSLTKKMKKLHVQFASFLNTILEDHKISDDVTSGNVDLLRAFISLKMEKKGCFRTLKSNLCFWCVPKTYGNSDEYIHFLFLKPPFHIHI